MPPLGVYNSFNQAANFINGMYRYWNIEGYIQDTWKITRRLTLDYGLRTAWYQPQYDASLQASTFVLSQWSAAQAPRLYFPAIVNNVRSALDPVTGRSCPPRSSASSCRAQAALPMAYCKPARTASTSTCRRAPRSQWGPRFGIAWDVTGKQNLVMRTGGGIYYDRFQGNRVFDFVRNPPLGIEPVFNYGFVKDINPSSALLSPPNLYAADPVGKIPTSYNFTFGVQSRLPGQFVLDTAYVGSLFRHLQDNRNLNPVPYGADFLPAKSGSDPQFHRAAGLKRTAAELPSAVPRLRQCHNL